MIIFGYINYHIINLRCVFVRKLVEAIEGADEEGRFRLCICKITVCLIDKLGRHLCRELYTDLFSLIDLHKLIHSLYLSCSRVLFRF